MDCQSLPGSDWVYGFGLTIVSEGTAQSVAKAIAIPWDLIDQALQREEVFITRRGTPFSVIIIGAVGGVGGRQCVTGPGSWRCWPPGSPDRR